MGIKILPGTDETLEKMKGQEIALQGGEGVVYVKVVLITQDTISKESPTQLVSDAPAVILCGSLAEIRKQLDEWFEESTKQYGAHHGHNQ